jgi:hypothetical protein
MLILAHRGDGGGSCDGGLATQVLLCMRKTTTPLLKRYVGPVLARPCGLGCDGTVRPGAPSLILFFCYVFFLFSISVFISNSNFLFCFAGIELGFPPKLYLGADQYQIVCKDIFICNST